MSAATDRGAAARDAQATREQKRRDELAAAEAKALERRYQAWVYFVVEEQARVRASETTDDLMVAPIAPKPDARVSRAERKELSGLLEERRQQEGIGADTASRSALLEQIARELEGKAHPDGWAVMSYAGRSTAFDHRAVVGRMRATDFTTNRTPSRWMVMAGIGAVLMLLVCAIGALRTIGGGRGASASATVLVDSKRVTTADITAAALDRQALTLRRSPAMPTTLCTDSILTPGKEATLVLTTSIAVQTYEPVATDRADVRLSLCQGGAAIWTGRLEMPDRPQGATTAPSGAITVVGSEADPAGIAADQMRIAVQLADATFAESVLVLADGSSWPASSTGDAATPILQFLVPRAATPQRAALLQSSTTPPQRLPLDLPAPQSRLSILQARVGVSEVQAQQEQGDTLTLTATLTLLPGATALTLLPEDVLVLDDAARPLSATWMPPTLEVGTPATVTIAVAGTPDRPTTIVVAGQRFAIGTP